MPSEINIVNCPSCQSENLYPFYEVNSVPVHSCLMLNTEQEAIDFPHGDVQLAHCNDCGFVTNLKFNPKWSAYAPNYEDQQAFSATFNSFAGKLVKDLVLKYNLNDKKVIEIGCSKGDFLALLCEAGNNSGIGIDPSVLPGRVITNAADRIQFIEEYYNSEHTNLKTDFICCRHTLEHIQPVKEFIDYIAEAVNKNPGIPVMIEVPDTVRVLKENAFEDIYYEHCSYFTPGTLASLVRRAGLAVYDLRWEYDDQYLIIECGDDFNKNKSFDIEEALSETKNLVSNFCNTINATRAKWIEYINNLKADNNKIVVWGSGSKCVAFLSVLDVINSIDSIIDINPNRQGKFIPGIAKSIDSPDALVDLKPDVIIIMNRIYEQEIKLMLERLKVSAEIVTL